jgi:hypothetical protein
VLHVAIMQHPAFMTTSKEWPEMRNT